MFNNRVALITGGTRGIGLAIAKELAANGVNIAITASSPAADEAVNAIKGMGVDCAYYSCNVADGTLVTDTVKQVIADFGKIDILINNAGVTADKLLIAMTESDFNRVIDVNLKGAFLVTKACMRQFVKNSYGRIVNISSVVGLMGNAGQANYAASKAGLIGFTKSVAKEYAAKGVTCNAVAPGFIKTDMTAELPPQAKEKIMAAIPAGRMADPAEVARAVSFLADDLSGYITGEVIKVDGGMYI
ncbi:MAG: 3-oxoacyl-[acyl-carrier-protein] reductase [Clostridia bacterium]|nr:3-oxoacyl-[acyl-carrier-protein] reductase [Clostridia bacterium]